MILVALVAIFNDELHGYAVALLQRPYLQRTSEPAGTAMDHRLDDDVVDVARLPTTAQRDAELGPAAVDAQLTRERGHDDRVFDPALADPLVEADDDARVPRDAHGQGLGRNGDDARRLPVRLAARRRIRPRAREERRDGRCAERRQLLRAHDSAASLA